MKHKTEDYKLTATKYYLKNKDKLSMKQICDIFKCSKQSLSRWVNRYDKDKSIKRYNRKPISYKITNLQVIGRQRGSTGGIDKPDEYDDEFLVKMKLEVIVEDEDAEKVTEAIKKAAYSGKIGDGKIFIYNIDQVIRIRTGEKDSDAV